MLPSVGGFAISSDGYFFGEIKSSQTYPEIFLLPRALSQKKHAFKYNGCTQSCTHVLQFKMCIEERYERKKVNTHTKGKDLNGFPQALENIENDQKTVHAWKNQRIPKMVKFCYEMPV